MLVLTRRRLEAVHVNGPSRVLVVEATGRVRLGFDAHPDVEVWREEMFDRGVVAPDGAFIGRAEAQRAGFGEQWAALRKLVDSK